jgi:rare lipoprotein A
MRTRASMFVCAAGLLAVSAAIAQTPAAGTSAPAPAPAATAPSSPPPAATSGNEETGLAAVYSDKLAGHRTASGKRYDPHKLTAAHKTLPFGTKVMVTNVKNGKSTEVTITDRGPKQANRILDISPGAAHALGIRKNGMAEVRLAVVEGNSTAR